MTMDTRILGDGRVCVTKDKDGNVCSVSKYPPSQGKQKQREESTSTKD